MKAFYDEQIEELKQSILNGMLSVIDACQKRQRGEMAPEVAPDVRGALHTCMDELAEAIAWKLDRAWVQALLAARVSYSDTNKVRQMAKDNIEALIDGRALPWVEWVRP